MKEETGVALRGQSAVNPTFNWKLKFNQALTCLLLLWKKKSLTLESGRNFVYSREKIWKSVIRMGINLPCSGEVNPHPTPALLELSPQIITVGGGQVNRIRLRGDGATFKVP